MDLNGKCAIVTGSGGGGCGRAIALRLAREGARVVVSDIQEAGGLETVRLIHADGSDAVFRRADVSREAEVRELIAFAEAAYGRLDILVNNASGPEYGSGGPLDLWKETVEIELLGTMHTSRHAIDAMRRSGGGAIVNMSSISALWHGRRNRAPAVPAYDAAKAGVLRLTTMLGWLGAEKIRVNALAPGWIASPAVRSYVDSVPAADRQSRGVPSRLLTPEEVAGAVVRLATDESLCGRVLVWWSEDQPRLIEWGDRGYEKFT